jgi:hypothetical protein
MFEHRSDLGADAAKSREAEKCDAVGDSAVEDRIIFFFPSIEPVALPVLST